MLKKEDVSPEALERESERLVARLEVEKLEDALYFPQFLQIESTRYCNARCPFCLNGKWDMSAPLMPDNLFDKIAEELRDYKDWIRIVDIQRAGEPLTDKKIFHKIKRMKDIGIRFVNLSTNASLLNEERSRKLLEAGLDELLISIDSVEKSTYEKLRIGLDFDQVIENVKRFFRIRDEIRPETIIRVRGIICFDMEDSRHKGEIERWERFWEPLRKPHDRIYMRRLHTWGNEHVWQERPEAYGREWDYAPCIIPWSTLHITSMGIIPLCGMDNDAKAHMGNIYEKSIAAIWRDEGFERVRELHRSGRRNEIGFCQGCHVFNPDSNFEKSDQKGFFPVKPKYTNINGNKNAGI